MSQARNFLFPALLLSLLSLLVASAVLTRAQDAATGALRGTVSDPSGSRVPQATIVLVNIATSARHTTTSDAEGRFALDLLLPGDYTARATAEGMSPQLSPQLHIDVGAATELEFQLTIAGAQENVTVSSTPALVETKPSAVSTLLDERAIGDFPLNGRRFSDLALFSPGVTQDPRSLTSSSNGDLSFGGIRGFQNSFLVDGGDNNNAFYAQAADAIANRTISPPKPSRSSASPPTPTAPNSAAPVEPWSTSSLNPAPTICTAPVSTTSATAPSEPPIPSWHSNPKAVSSKPAPP